MGNFGVPPLGMGGKEIPSDIYEVIVKDVREIANTWYDPAKDPDSKKTQLEWDFVIRESGEYEGLGLRYYTGSSIGRHPRNKLTNFLKVLDPTFDIDVAYSGWDDFYDHVVNKPVRVTTEATPRKEGEGNYAKVVGALATKMGEISSAEMIKLIMGGAPV